MSLSGVRAIAFDLDDTLTDWWTGIARAADTAGAPDLLDRVRRETWVERDGVVINRHHWRLLHEADRFVAARQVDAFLAALDPPLFDDVVPALETLRNHGRVRLALLTNNPFGAEVVERHGLHADVFDCVVVASSEIRKPDPRAFAPLVDALAMAPTDIAYVGDSITADVEGSRAAGMRAVWIDRWNDPWPVPPEVVRVTSLRELAALC
jgi:HAD superfamily hydrolase (TIGR01549 family)